MHRFFCLLALVAALGSPSASADDAAGTSPSARLEAAKQRVLAEQEFELKYKFHPREEVRWKVVHLATTETRIQGNTQTSQSRSASVKVWKIEQVDEQGNITFVHQVDSANMWQQVSGRQEIRYDSENDKEPPLEYEAVSRTLGQPLAKVTIDPQGQVVKREGDAKSLAFGVGDIAVPLPAGRVKAGRQWEAPSELIVRLPPENRTQRIKTRQLYTLEKVEAGVATIAVKTEVLTPVEDPRIEAQIMQQLTQGTLKFDVDAGRLIYKQMDWDEDVVGFNGADSNLKYLARFTEELLPAPPATARKPN